MEINSLPVSFAYHLTYCYCYQDFHTILNKEPQETWQASRALRHQLQIKIGDITCQEIEEAL